MNGTIDKLLTEVDADIATHFCEEVKVGGAYNPRIVQRWELLTDPVNAILNWQALRDRRKNK